MYHQEPVIKTCHLTSFNKQVQICWDVGELHVSLSAQCLVATMKQSRERSSARVSDSADRVVRVGFMG